jgi:hypothetical protein
MVGYGLLAEGAVEEAWRPAELLARRIDGNNSSTITRCRRSDIFISLSTPVYASPERR